MEIFADGQDQAAHLALLWDKESATYASLTSETGNEKEAAAIKKIEGSRRQRAGE
jgi:hypothetical protein